MNRPCQLILILLIPKEGCLPPVAQKSTFYDHDGTFYMKQKIIISVRLCQPAVLFSQNIVKPLLQKLRQPLSFFRGSVLEHLSSGYRFLVITVLVDADNQICMAIRYDLTAFFHICHLFPCIRVTVKPCIRLPVRTVCTSACSKYHESFLAISRLISFSRLPLIPIFPGSAPP